jgi:hypothetical protein
MFTTLGLPGQDEREKARAFGKKGAEVYPKTRAGRIRCPRQRNLLS